jgi:hypothetical protein
VADIAQTFKEAVTKAMRDTMSKPSISDRLTVLEANFDRQLGMLGRIITLLEAQQAGK